MGDPRVHRRPGVFAQIEVAGSSVSHEDIDGPARLKERGTGVFQMVKGGISGSLTGQLD